MLATLFVAMGLAMLSLLFTSPSWLHVSPGVDVLIGLTLLFGGLAMIGTGLFVPFQKKKLGAGMGLGIALVCVVYIRATAQSAGLSPSRAIAPRYLNKTIVHSASNSGIK